MFLSLVHEPGQFLAPEELKNIAFLVWPLGRASPETCLGNSSFSLGRVCVNRVQPRETLAAQNDTDSVLSLEAVMELSVVRRCVPALVIDVGYKCVIVLPVSAWPDVSSARFEMRLHLGCLSDPVFFLPPHHCRLGPKRRPFTLGMYTFLSSLVPVPPLPNSTPVLPCTGSRKTSGDATVCPGAPCLVQTPRMVGAWVAGLAFVLLSRPSRRPSASSTVR